MDTSPAYLSPAATARRYSIARSHLDNLVAAGRWPRPTKLGERCVRHNVALCDAFMAGRVDVAGRPVEEEAHVRA